MKVLLIVDMQNDFIDGSLCTEEAKEILPNVIQRIRTSEDDIVLFTQDTHGDDYLDTQEGRKLPIKHCIKDTHGWQIHPDLLAAWRALDDTMIIEELVDNALTKNTFGSKDLISLLTELSKDNEISEVEICGLCTDICVISNAFLIKAYFPETIIKVNPTCCAGTTPENHETALKAMRNCQVEIF